MILTWLKPIASEWQNRAQLGRTPHAVLLIGPAGTGKRATASWMVENRLNSGSKSEMPEFPFERPQHADLRWVEPLEDRQTIGVEQVRELGSQLGLTAYEGGGKVAVIEPANAMTANAANGLLKTLEEPPGDSLIILIADRAGRLPATIFSRCQRINFHCPSRTDSVAWLDRWHPGDNWVAALQSAGGAPLAAIEALNRLSDTDTMAREFADVAENRASPLVVAARWAKYDPPFVLDWLCGHIQGCIYYLSGTSTSHTGVEVADSVLRRIDRRNLFCYLDLINRLRGQAAGSYNVQLTFESLLIDWSHGLEGVAGADNNDGKRMSFGSG